ncbi:MAG TPA: hypothetical protein VK624_01670 [Steroidobacteraceae bacterium]|nr:hypothetical protein [Steroidobacteraceae bacterium]
MSLLSKLFGARGSETRTTTVGKPLRISKPRIGFLNLQGEPGASLAMEDRKVLAPPFRESFLTDGAVPRCEVIFLYCNVGADGRVAGSAAGIRDLTEAAGAYVAVVASENPPNNYMNALGPRNSWGANTVLVVDRKTNSFAEFFHSLFEAMKSGETMLMAWVRLAPQIPGIDHANAPGALMYAEAGHITFDG